MLKRQNLMILWKYHRPSFSINFFIFLYEGFRQLENVWDNLKQCHKYMIQEGLCKACIVFHETKLIITKHEKKVNNVTSASNKLCIAVSAEFLDSSNLSSATRTSSSVIFDPAWSKWMFKIIVMHSWSIFLIKKCRS